MSKIHESSLYKLAYVYIIAELYRNEYIKSKPINYPRNPNDFLNKLQFLIKGLCNKRIEEYSSYDKVSFSNSNFKIGLNRLDYIEKILLKSFINYRYFNNEYIQYLQYTFNDGWEQKIYIRLRSDIYSINLNNFKKDRIDDIYNSIIFVLNSFEIIHKYIDRIKNKNLTLYDVYLFFYYFACWKNQEFMQISNEIIESYKTINLTEQEIETFSQMTNKNWYYYERNDYVELLEIKRLFFDIPLTRLDTSEI